MTTWRKGLGSTSYSSQIQSAIPTYCPSCPPSLVLALVNQESGGNQYTSSGAVLTGSSGDTGLFQLLPSTAAGLNVDPTTPEGNIQGGLTLLQQLYNQFGDWTEALEAYNEGATGLKNQLAAGQTPTSAGYAASILAAAGPLDTSPAADTSTIDLSDASNGSDSSDTSASDASSDLFDQLDSFSVGGLSGGSLAIVAALVLGLAIWAAAR